MRKRKRIAIVSVALFISWLLTGGCVGVELSWRYIDSYNHNYRPWLQADVAPNYRTYGVPFLFTYTEDAPPYDADFIYYTQDIVEGAELTVDRLAIRYADGTEFDLTDQVRSPMAAERYEMWYVDNHTQVKKPCLRVKWTIPNCVTQKGAFVVLISGSLRKGDRVLESFDTSLDCTPFGETRYYSRWYWWLLSNA